jgi:hypothetical protein
MSVTATEPKPNLALDGAASAIASARRATVAARYAANSLTVEWRSLGELLSIEDEWRELAARALEPNVFYEPAFALEAAAVFGASAGAVLVWSGTAPRKLLGFFPARIETRRYGVKLPVLVGWTHPYAPFGTPLVECEAAEPVIAAWLAHIADNTALPCCCPMSGRSVRLPRNCTRSCSADGYRLSISTFTKERCLRRAATACCTSSARSGSTSTRKCAVLCAGWAM